MTIHFEQVIQDCRNERLKRIAAGGVGPEHDDAQPLDYFLEAIGSKYCPQALLNLRDENLAEVRRRLIQIAALALVAVESLDRRGR